jgi:hypothetical protein
MNLCKALLPRPPSPVVTGWGRMRLSQRQFVLRRNRNRRAGARGALLDFGYRLGQLYDMRDNGPSERTSASAFALQKFSAALAQAPYIQKGDTNLKWLSLHGCCPPSVELAALNCRGLPGSPSLQRHHSERISWP